MEQKDRLIMSRKELKRKGILKLAHPRQLNLQEAYEETKPGVIYFYENRYWDFDPTVLKRR